MFRVIQLFLTRICFLFFILFIIPRDRQIEFMRYCIIVKRMCDHIKKFVNGIVDFLLLF